MDEFGGVCQPVFPKGVDEPLELLDQDVDAVAVHAVLFGDEGFERIELPVHVGLRVFLQAEHRPGLRGQFLDAFRLGDVGQAASKQRGQRIEFLGVVDEDQIDQGLGFEPGLFGLKAVGVLEIDLGEDAVIGPVTQSGRKGSLPGLNRKQQKENGQGAQSQPQQRFAVSEG